MDGGRVGLGIVMCGLLFTGAVSAVWTSGPASLALEPTGSRAPAFDSSATGPVRFSPLSWSMSNDGTFLEASGRAGAASMRVQLTTTNGKVTESVFVKPSQTKTASTASSSRETPNLPPRPP